MDKKQFDKLCSLSPVALFDELQNIKDKNAFTDEQFSMISKKVSSESQRKYLMAKKDFSEDKKEGLFSQSLNFFIYLFSTRYG